MSIRSIDEFVNKVQVPEVPKKMAVAAAADLHTIEAAVRAAKNKFVEPIFVGCQEKISSMITQLGEEPSDYAVINEPNDIKAARTAVKLAREGKSDFLMKGALNTADLLRAVLDKENGLPHEKTVTHMTLTGVPDYDKIVVLCDVAIIPYPTLEQKEDQIKAVTKAMHSFGYDENLKVAVIAAAETVSNKIIETLEASELKQMNLDKKINGCIVEGPISLDLALSKSRAETKKYQSPVAGSADVLLFPNLVSGSVYAKTLEMSGWIPIGMVLGAGVPIAVSSRAASAETKYNTIIITSMTAR